MATWMLTADKRAQVVRAQVNYRLARALDEATSATFHRLCETRLGALAEEMSAADVEAYFCAMTAIEEEVGYWTAWAARRTAEKTLIAVCQPIALRLARSTVERARLATMFINVGKHPAHYARLIDLCARLAA